MSDELSDYLATHPEPALVEALVPDHAGYLRGKHILPGEFAAAFDAGFNLPGGTLMLDTMGTSMPGLPGWGDGDPDVRVHIVPGSLTPVPWARHSHAQVLCTFHNVDGSPYYADSRHVLERTARPLREQGYGIQMALEMEFFLLDANNDVPAPKTANVPGTCQPKEGNQAYQPEELQYLEAFIDELGETCEAQHIPIGTVLSEYAPGQFEVNLHHVDDPVRACDHAVLLKRAIKAVAPKHGYVACFMAKPFMPVGGSGMHVHVSLVDANGVNAFSLGREELARPPYGERFRAAVGGLTETMEQCMPIFCPNHNSYRRLRPDFYAPVMPCWGTNHRNVALRVPLSSPANTRIEHRVAGADANPYLVAAAVLAGLHHGMENRCDPGRHVAEGEELELDVALPVRLESALLQYEAGAVLPRYLGERFHADYATARRVEGERFHAEVTDRDYQWYLRSA